VTCDDETQGEQCLFVGTRGSGFAGPLGAPP